MMMILFLDLLETQTVHNCLVFVSELVRIESQRVILEMTLRESECVPDSFVVLI